MFEGIEIMVKLYLEMIGGGTCPLYMLHIVGMPHVSNFLQPLVYYYSYFYSFCYSYCCYS